MAEQHGGGRVLGVRAGEPDRCLDRHRDSVAGDRRREGLNHALGDQLRLTRVEHLGQEQGEFVATEPRRGIGAAQALVQAVRDLDEHRVAGRVSVLGVDPPEVLEVDGDDAHDVAFGVALEQRALDAVDEEDAVGELGERVVKGAIGELALERGEPQQRIVQAAAFDGQGDQVREVLEVADRRSGIHDDPTRASRAPCSRRCATHGAGSRETPREIPRRPQSRATHGSAAASAMCTTP